MTKRKMPLRLTRLQHDVLDRVCDSPWRMFRRADDGGPGVVEELRERGLVDLSPAVGGLWIASATPKGRDAAGGE